jgi:hypothetical protein
MGRRDIIGIVDTHGLPLIIAGDPEPVKNHEQEDHHGESNKANPPKGFSNHSDEGLTR